MIKKEVLDLTYHKVYYIKSDNVSFYLTVPKNVESTNISIELKSKMGNYNLEQNDEIWVMDNVKNTFSFIDNYNITLALPILNDDEIAILEKIDNNNYDILDKILAEVINSSYKILSDENIKIANQVILINNDRYKTFITWFATRYKERLVCKNLLELIQLFNVNATSYKKLETPVMNFVVGSYNTEVDAPKIVKEEEKKQVLVKPVTLQPSSGFASYLVIVIITIIVVAAIAILIITA